MTRTLLQNLLNRIRKMYLLLALIFVAVITVINFPDISEVESHVHAINFSTYFTVLLLALGSYFLRSLRWLSYMRKIELKASDLHHYLIYLSGFSFTASPGKAGELMRGAHLSRLGVPFSSTVISFLSERALDVIVVLSIGLYAVVAITNNVIYGAGTIALLVLPFLIKPMLASKWVSHFKKKKTSNKPQFAFIESIWQPSITLRSMMLTVVAWSAQGAGLYFFLIGLGHEVSVEVCISIYCLSLLIGAASLIPGGLGATELSMGWLLTQVGVSGDVAVVAALFTRSLTLWPSVLIGLFCSALLARNIKKERG